MPKRGLDSCMDVMEFLKRTGFEKEVPAGELLKAIQICIGFEQKTRDKYMQSLQMLKFIEPSGNGIFKLNMDKVYELQL